MFRLKRAEMRSAWLERFEGRDAVDLDLHGIRIGPFAVVGFPGEPFASIGVAVRERIAVPGDAHDRLHQRLERLRADRRRLRGRRVRGRVGSAFDVGAADALIAGALALLEELR